MRPEPTLIALPLILLAASCASEPEPKPEQRLTESFSEKKTGAAEAIAANALALEAQPEPAELRSVRHVKASGQLGPGRGTLLILLEAPPGAKLTEGAPLKVKARGRDLKFPEQISTKLDPSKLPVRLPIDVADGAADPAKVELTYYYCIDGERGSCQPERALLQVDLDLSGTGPDGEAYFTYAPKL